MAEKITLSEVAIPLLTEGDGYWRIDWLGNLSYPDRIQRHSQPSVRVMLSKLQGPPRQVDLNHKRCSNYEQQRSISLPIAVLPLLRIGDIWRKEHYVASPTYATETFENIQINNEHCQQIEAGSYELDEETGSKRYFLPSSHHPYHMAHRNSKCVVISQPESTTKIVVPQLELARFYFGSSAALISKLFSYGMILDGIYAYNETIPQQEDGSAFVQLRPKMKDKSAADIARIALDPYAKHAAILISKSIVKCAKEKRSIYAETDFPFRGETTLTLIGKWLPYTTEGRIFCCYRIVRCTAAFPFESLKFFRDNAGNKDGTNDPSRPIAYEGSGPRLTPNHIDGAALLTDEEPYAFLDDTEILIPEETPFPDLTIKTVEKERQKPCEYQAAEHTEIIPIDTGGLGVGEGGTDKAISPADLGKEDQKGVEAVSTSEKLSADFETFFSILDELNRREGVEGISFECPYPGATDPRCSIFPLISTETGRKSTWPFIDYIKGTCHETKLRRRVVIAKIRFEKKIRYFMEIERRVDGDGKDLDKCSMLLLHSHTNGIVSEIDLRAILTECAERRGQWLTDESLTHLHRHPIKHTFSNRKLEQETISEFANKIWAKL
ncbi:hypothetical protein CAter282_4361 [Collimonas arenae]|uniref:TnsE C-terminal domain-containing protein n=1 Tax=Collimonas arenae TaxID=279058 RepID=A0A127PWJ1_9BURK|nr:hypothetical protein [Collimonas arenae]AMP02126.1 hypothetical protein CAter10_4738 [Collimonas arenae]AMP12021.1 hypothetical protein CAter282_4361 [Collimonas arenae]